MNPAANAAVSGGVAGAAVVILNYVCTLIPHVGALPSEVQAAVAVLLTAGAGYYFHRKTSDQPASPIQAQAQH